jgi:perosamine synthetase
MIPIAQPLIGDEEKRAVLDVLDSGHLAEGSRVRALEEAFAA